MATMDPAVVEYRLNELKATVAQLDLEKADAKDVARLADEMQGLKRMGYWVVGALLTATITFGVWALQLATAHG